jgi:hypothetical protein
MALNKPLAEIEWASLIGKLKGIDFDFIFFYRAKIK